MTFFWFNLINGISTTRIRVHVCVVYCDYVLTGGVFLFSICVCVCYIFFCTLHSRDGWKEEKKREERVRMRGERGGDKSDRKRQ